MQSDSPTSDCVQTPNKETASSVVEDVLINAGNDDLGIPSTADLTIENALGGAQLAGETSQVKDTTYFPSLVDLSVGNDSLINEILDANDANVPPPIITAEEGVKIPWETHLAVIERMASAMTTMTDLMSQQKDALDSLISKVADHQVQSNKNFAILRNAYASLNKALDTLTNKVDTVANNQKNDRSLTLQTLKEIQRLNTTMSNMEAKMQSLSHSYKPVHAPNATSSTLLKKQPEVALNSVAKEFVFTKPATTASTFIFGAGSKVKDDPPAIEFLEPEYQQDKLAKKWGFRVSDIKQLNDREFFMPGMVDTHIHAPQYSFAGSALDKPLLRWLNDYTFPTEAKYKNEEFARDVYTKVVRRTLKNGTTTACYFATIHTDSSLILADIANDIGQRSLVGKVCMDTNQMYPQYKEETSICLAETKRFAETLLSKKYPRVRPIITPRFALSCTEELMSELSNLAASLDIHIQSHISEAKEEVASVKAIFPHQENYSTLYQANRLLTSKTVMAHGCYLSDKELDMFKHHGAAIAHCPNSNTSMCSGHLDVRNVLKRKVKIGLGTDVAGGYSPSMLDAIRRTMDTSKILFIQDPSVEVLTYQEVFRLATLGGSQALALDDVIGNFEVGKEFDALLINTGGTESPFEVFADDTKEDIIQKFLYLGDDRNIKEVYVAGKNISLTNMP